MLSYYPGPMAKVAGIILRFRKGRIAFSAFVGEVFRQVGTFESVTGALRFLWRPQIHSLMEPHECQMTVHLFGAGSCFCANYDLGKIP